VASHRRVALRLCRASAVDRVSGVVCIFNMRPRATNLARADEPAKTRTVTSVATKSRLFNWTHGASGATICAHTGIEMDTDAPHTWPGHPGCTSGQGKAAGWKEGGSWVGQGV
jgi:hypothetical protein